MRVLTALNRLRIGSSGELLLHGNEPLVSINGRELTDHVRDC